MLELAKSSLSFSWAMSLLGTQQFAKELTRRDPGQQPTQGAQAAFYSITQATRDEFSDLMWAAFQIGDNLQRELVNLAFDMLTLRVFAPSYLNRLSSAIAQQAQETLRTFSPGRNSRLALQELKNNYEVFNLVKNVSSILAIPSDSTFPLEELVERAYALGEYPDLWAIEGLGHDYAMTFWGKDKPIRGILTDGRAARLPAKSLTMMHAGLGLAFAQQLVNTITPFSPDSEIRRVLREFFTLCKDNSREGYVGAAYESLGLVTRFWHAQMVPIVDRHLLEVEPDAPGFFWHGAGRALYFLPIYFVPGLLSPWRAAEREPRSELARLNMLAGLAWATTLVNMRQPEIMANLLKYQAARLTRTDAFSNGVMSAIIMGYDITPEDAYISEFLRHQPDSADGRLVQSWDKFVGTPANEGLQRYYPVLKHRGQLGEVFRYQNLSELVARLENEPV
jgi:hypothetical protein